MDVMISETGEVTFTDTEQRQMAEAVNPKMMSELGAMSNEQLLSEVKEHFPQAHYLDADEAILSTGLYDYLLKWVGDTIIVSYIGGDYCTATIDEFVNAFRLSEVSPRKMLNQLDQIALLVEQENADDLDEVYEQLKEILGQQKLHQDHS